MMHYVRQHLGAKLLFSYLVIIIVSAAILILASQFVLPKAFNRHMSGMTLAPGASAGMGNATGMGMMNGQGFDAANATPLYADFRAGFNEALIYAALAAVVVAIFLSLYLSSSVTAPVKAMSHATQRIADGRYEERVAVHGEDELSQLAIRFNQMAEKLNETESRRRRLIGDVSHELRTPLSAIKGSMEGLIDGVLPATNETYQEIHAEADRLNRLVDDLQELSRVESQALDLDIHPLHVGSLVQTVIKRTMHQAESKQITLDLQLTAGLPRLLADEDRAIQVLTNLVGNALQYTAEGGQVMISARPMGNEVQISVQDTGIGISQDHLPHLFDRFYRVDKSRSRQSGGGSGIGLTIARALIERQGGRIWAESSGDGQGSTFHFTLPVAKP
jgi:signal transduction histidine kinase